MTKQLSALTLATSLLLLGCASAPKAPTRADGQKIAVEVVIDGGWEQIDESDPKAVNQRRQLVNFMRNETVRQLNQGGYAASLQDSAKGPTEGARTYKLRIVKYDPGNAAARVVVGFGAGAATLDLAATYSEGPRVLLNREKSFASSMNWRKIVRKINLQVMQEMAAIGAT